MHLTMKDSTKIFVNDMGEGHPVILIHGWPLNADMWEYQAVPLLENGFRVISYDRRGFGRSSRHVVDYNYDIFASDLSEIIEQLQLNHVSLVGFSMGGGEIARYLGTYGSEKIASATLIASVVPYMLKTDSNPDGVPESAFFERMKKLREDRPATIKDFGKTFYGVGMVKSPVSDEILHWTQIMAFQADPKATLDSVSAFGTTDFRGDMKAFDIPTMIIHGTEDKNVPIDATGRASARMIPDSVLKVYDGAAHGLVVTHKEQVSQDLIHFLQNLSVRPSPRRSQMELPIQKRH